MAGGKLDIRENPHRPGLIENYLGEYCIYIITNVMKPLTKIYIHENPRTPAPRLPRV